MKGMICPAEVKNHCSETSVSDSSYYSSQESADRNRWDHNRPKKTPNSNQSTACCQFARSPSLSPCKTPVPNWFQERPLRPVARAVECRSSGKCLDAVRHCQSTFAADPATEPVPPVRAVAPFEPHFPLPAGAVADPFHADWPFW